MLTTTALNALRTYFAQQISYAQYKVGSKYYKADLEDTEILTDGRISIAFTIDHTVSGDITVTEVQLYDHNGQLWASKEESIDRADEQEGIYYRFRFTISEE